ncbi:ABC transporter ATP-binding protein [Sanguibacter antarcticus]|uniref:ABC-type multidrug transport system fused ATPase/permease subunit n=1 Tax=Sanguibacter antarcticus TaxID=372484 RepID=A0A2A9E0D8_9MICO|nr:ABC transporter ATP-binding protein [Sanguibacter antarcticus]PFG32507.1 ABC-type multidrug transport system fused ATPase/permease subunit [Sanguibacter antarcticus]
MSALWRTVREILPVLPEGSSRFLVMFALLSGASSILDVVALGLLALCLAPMIAGTSVTLPVLGTLSEPADFRNILIAVGVLIVAKSVFQISLQWFATRRFAKFELAISRELLRGFFASPWTDRLQRNSTELVRSTDVGVATTVSGVLIPFAMLAGELCTFIAVLTVLVVAAPVMALATVLYFGLIGAVLLRWVLRKSVQAGRVNRSHSTRSARLLSEMMQSLKEITLRGKADSVAELVLGVRQQSSQARANMSFLAVVPRYVLEAALIGGFGIAAAIGYLTGGSTGALSAVALFGVAGFRIIPSLTRFQGIMSQTAAALPFAQTAIEDIRRGQGYLAARVDGPVQLPVPDDATFLDLDKVTFTYPTGVTPAVRDVTLRIPFGQSVALVGASGSGKSTLVDIVLGLLEPSSGEMRVGGTPLVLALDSWRSRVGYVPQDVSLFDATVAQNVALEWDDTLVDKDRVREALRRAQALDVIEARANGIDSSVGERGLGLSGGQRQRLGIARALYSDPLVLIMDEATSALDTSTEAAVTSAISDLRGELTLVVVAHRLSTIRHSDIVCFMRDGELVAHGTFDEVVAAVPDFAHQAALAGLTAHDVPRTTAGDLA